MANPKPNPAYQFKKGEHKAGRAVGTPNKLTVSARAVLDEAFHKVGGVDRLAQWILKSPQNEYAWWTQIWPRTIPLSATVRGQISHNVEMSHSELEQALRARGLTSIAEHGVFGYDAPPLLEAAPRLDHEPDEPIER